MFIYDAYPGGIGLSEPLYRLHSRLLAQSLSLIEACPCREGCPSCVGVANLRPPIHQDPDVTGGWLIPSKEAARIILREVIGK